MPYTTEQLNQLVADWVRGRFTVANAQWLSATEAWITSNPPPTGNTEPPENVLEDIVQHVSSGNL